MNDVSIATFSELVLAWFDEHGRKNLPWQQKPTRYSVWVSEIMLQQTQVSTVIDYYTRFILRFPDIQSLANAEQDEVLHLWTGLGYYARARNLHKAAKMVCERYAGVFPDQFENVISLPGIGRSTAAAILSLADNQAYVILDGNVKRVLSRYMAIEGWPGNKKIEDSFWKVAEELKPNTRFAHYTQAMMDLGATLCTRSKPNCEACPVNRTCMAFLQGRQGEFPHKKPKKDKPTKTTTMYIPYFNGSVMMKKRPSEGIWGGLYGFVEDEQLLSQFEKHWVSHESKVLEPFTHTFSHFHLQIKPVVVMFEPKATTNGVDEIAEADRIYERRDCLWFKIDESIDVGLSAPTVKIIKTLNNLF